jgi:enolase-phosphatase E1
MVWGQGYRARELKGQVYADAVAALRQWSAASYRLFVYSSDSVQAQRLIFGCSEAGDLTPLFSGYFDTTLGHKRDPEAYRRVANALALPASDVLFLSGVVEELDAARAAGMRTCGLSRTGGELPGHVTVRSFSMIDPGALAGN